MDVGNRLAGASLWVLLVYLIGMPVLAQAQRQHGAHVHGAGKLNLVQEGNQVHIELEIPGMDIVGFEHKASTAPQKQAVKEAMAVLEQGDALFVINAEAKCTFDKAEIEVAMIDEEDEDKHGHGEDKHRDGDHHKDDKHRDHDHHKDEKHAKDDDHHKDEKHAKAEADEDSHSEFHAEYVFQCASPDALQQLQVGLFDKFKGAESLQVQWVTARKQSAQQLRRESPVVRLD